MFLLTVIVGVLVSVFSTVVMSYIAMATPIGPWIAPTLVLIALLLFRALSHHSSRAIVLVAAAGSIGGILATGCAFSFPTIYFLDHVVFNTWMASPWIFAGRLTVLAACAGGFGFFLANLFEYKLCVQDKLPFPIALLISKMVSAGNQLRKAYELMVGFLSTALFCLLQDGLCGVKPVLPKGLQLIPSFVFSGICIPGMRFDLWPMLWAIGFITGHVIAIPLVVGAISRLCIIDPLNAWLFASVPSVEFTFAFCSGMVLLGAIDSMLHFPKMMRQVYAWLSGARVRTYNVQLFQGFMHSINGVEQSLLFVGVVFLLLVLGFSCVQIAYLLIFTALFSYQMVVIAAKWGMAPLGRFATFVMLPAMLLFKLDKVQVVFIALFVEVCGGVAYDLLCARVVAAKNYIDQRAVKRYQYLGLCVSVLTVGVVFWVLINACPLGSAELFAYKAQSRSLLVNALLHGNGFNGYVLLMGALFSFILMRLKLSPVLVLGGLLMPFNLSIGLVFGGMLTYCVKDREQWEPFWSGVFAANSVWMLLRAVC